MLNEVKYIVVLANEMDASGVLNQESADRADFAGKLALEHPKAKLVTPGWAYRPDSSIRIGDSMKDFIHKRFMIPSSNFVSHLDSRDTVGDAVYCRDYFEEIGIAYSLELVTSDYHCQRALKIFQFIFGHSVEIKVHPISTKNPSSRFESEEASTEAFLRTFNSISPGDFEAIKNRLLKAHPLYIPRDSKQQNSVLP
jgi:uncharacterized SAM-binding protein YcdF (DUF218 family)